LAHALFFVGSGLGWFLLSDHLYTKLGFYVEMVAIIHQNQPIWARSLQRNGILCIDGAKQHCKTSTKKFARAELCYFIFANFDAD